MNNYDEKAIKSFKSSDQSFQIYAETTLAYTVTAGEVAPYEPAQGGQVSH